MFQRSRFLKICASGDEKAFEKALRNIPDVNFYRQHVGTPLTEACRRGHLDIVKKLIAHGADVNQSVKYSSPLMMAGTNGDIDILKILIEAGANLNYQNDSATTTLMRTALYSNYDCSKTLIKAGAHLNLQDNHGKTALMHCLFRQRHNYEIAKVLVQAGADLSIKDHKGLTVVDIARKQGKKEFLALFDPKPERTVGYHFISAEKVTQVGGTCPVNGLLSEIFNFENQNVILINARSTSTPISFPDYISQTKNGKETINAAYDWLKAHEKGAPTYPFKRVVDIRKRK